MMSKQRLRPGILQVVLLFLILIAGVSNIGCSGTPENDVPNQADEIWREIIPEQGTATTYGIPLSLDNTQQFIDWFNTIELSDDEQMLREVALGTFMAPCCDDYPMSEC
jgi:hypothetical protein